MDRIHNISLGARKWLIGALVGLCVAISSCSPKIVERVVYQTRDSIITKLDTVEVKIDHTEYVRDWTGMLDTLILSAEDGKVESRSWVDTSKSILAGELKTLPRTASAVVPTKEEYHQKDSVAIKEIPVEVKVPVKVTPKWCWWSLILNFILIAAAVLYILWKLKILHL